MPNSPDSNQTIAPTGIADQQTGPTAVVAHFIRNRIREDVAAGKNGGQVITRFPPEPNGYLHIGHAKSIGINFGMAEEFGGSTNLRFDDTNPGKEEALFYDRIMEDVRWLGFDWQELHHASDYFDQLFDFACELINTNKAYVDSLDAEQMRVYRGTLTEPGRESPDRNRSAAENMDLFQRMKNGEFADGEYTLRARIDMAAPNINMRDPILYRIRKIDHHRTGSDWCIYPTYDFAHGISDAIEGITHSLCTLEFEDHRPLYDWLLDHISIQQHPQQIEFARGNIDFTVLSKRRLKRLVEEGFVDGWDDPRMPTLAGLRRRGYPPLAIRKFWDSVGVSKSESIIPMIVLENAVRDELNENAPRSMAVLNPLKIILSNFDASETRWLEVPLHPQHEDMGTRRIALTRELYIEQDDFMLDPPGKYFRLKPGGEVRLRNAFIIRCDEVVENATGGVDHLVCSFDPDTMSGLPGAKRKVKGTIHWVSASHGKRATLRLYDRLFKVANPIADKAVDFTEHLNPASLQVIDNAIIEPDLATQPAGHQLQFERTGYFAVDPDSTPEHPVLNRTVSLRDSWAKIAGQ
ncbi:MAG: glutamine--tRNA ligase/YqeY domain fusion protein [Gammaproteobacteria bacterium]|jgi:glutaminyl-tRNA synthetase|nr:glutamine--tRNA ligase/YqeY domain fusion protein [Gammaproteobacteria bacterium]